MRNGVWLATILLAASMLSCGSGEVSTHLTAEERFKKAMALFDDEAYTEAINEFTIITLQFQGSAYADDAQFYLGECRFNRGEYVLGAFEYSTLKRNMPASSLVPQAQYKLALSYYRLSPKSNLDQQYTKRAIDELQTFVDYYPANEHATEADSLIRELTTRLAKKQYDTARLYATMEFYKASLFCYDDVIEKYHDTEYAPFSYLGKTEVLLARKKYAEARGELNKFYERFPNSVLRVQADKLRERVDSEINTNPPLSGKGADDRQVRLGTNGLSTPIR